MAENKEEKQKLWYVVNTYSGHEAKVKEKLEAKAESMGMQDYIYRVIIPETTEVEIKDGIKKEKTKKMFPGYVIVEMVMTDEAWYIVRNTPGVTGFIGSSGKGAKPFPLTPAEVDRVLSAMGMSRLEGTDELKVDDMVKVINGPFANMYGKVKTADMEHNKVEVALDLFGQETVVELTLSEIQKA